MSASLLRLLPDFLASFGARSKVEVVRNHHSAEPAQQFMLEQ